MKGKKRRRMICRFLKRPITMKTKQKLFPSVRSDVELDVGRRDVGSSRRRGKCHNCEIFNLPREGIWCAEESLLSLEYIDIYTQYTHT